MSRNPLLRLLLFFLHRVAPREGRVSRNIYLRFHYCFSAVAPREGRVSRNAPLILMMFVSCKSRPARGV